MKANEYKAWYRRNDPQDARRALKEYDRPFKERYERPPMYSPASEEYHHYDAMLDLSAKQDAYQAGEEKKTQPDLKKKDRAKKSRGKSAGRGVVQTVVGQAAAVVVGGVVLVAGYQAITTSQAAIVETVEWDWSEDYANGILKLSNGSGELIAEVPVSTTLDGEVAPTCTEAGSKTYTATAEYEDHTYTDTRVEVIPAIGHDYKVKSVDSSGNTVITVHECTHCHDEITTETVVEENAD